MQHESSDLKRGLLSAIGAHLLWGVFPLFWRTVGHVDPLVVVCHRILWAFACLLLVLPVLWRSMDESARWQLSKLLQRPRVWSAYATAAVLIAINWLTFIWAVNHDRVLQASLGYYINPLLNVCLGVVVLGERLQKLQWVAIAVAAMGVGVMTVAGGGLPWVSVILACSFATYALVKKRAALPSLLGLLLETAVLAVPALFFVAWFTPASSGILGAPDLASLLLLITGGMVTILPLAFFAYAAHRVPLATIGILQYIAPTIQFFIGALVLAEPFDRWRFLGFAFVWFGLAIYVASSRYRPAG